MTGSEHGRCIDCGRHTPLRLPRRFPHICTECLFPPTPADDPDLTLDKQEGIVQPSIIELLHARAALGFKFFRPFGDKAVEDYNRPWE